MLLDQFNLSCTRRLRCSRYVHIKLTIHENSLDQSSQNLSPFWTSKIFLIFLENQNGSKFVRRASFDLLYNLRKKCFGSEKVEISFYTIFFLIRYKAYYEVGGGEPECTTAYHVASIADENAYTFGSHSTEETWNHLAINIIEIQFNMKVNYFRFAPLLFPPQGKFFITFNEFDRRWYTADKMTDR